MVKVHLISGFLGAGKTTLIKKLLTALKDEKVILLENEYGEVGIDGGFMKDAGITVSELNSGCICCTMAGDFQKAMDELIDTYHPDRILVEPTGVGKLSEILAAVEKAKERHPDMEIAGCATVVDAGRCRMYMKNFGEFFIDQITCAPTVIFSRTQLQTPERVEKSRQLVEEKHPGVRIITTPWDDLSAEALLAVIEGSKPLEITLDDDDDDDEDEHEHHHHHHHDHDHDHDHEHEHHHHEHGEDCTCGCHDHDHEHHHHDHDEDEHEHHHHHDHEHEHEHGEGCTCGCHDHDHEHHHHHHHGHDADEIFDTIGMETAKRFTREDVETIIEKLGDEEEYGAILRAKGILQTPEGEWFQFDHVPGELVFRDGSADYTGRVAVIGAHLEAEAIRALLNA